MGEKSIPVFKWSRPGLLERMMGKPRRAERFVFDDLPPAGGNLVINMGDIHLKWGGGIWVNLGTDCEAAHQTLTEDEAQEMMEENQCLAAEVELLLDTNTNYELKTVHLRQKLQNLVDDIAHFPRMNSDSEVF
jgi:diadenosine tetraphosphate (Ap4A) HIT family hydrolase